MSTKANNLPCFAFSTGTKPQSLTDKKNQKIGLTQLGPDRNVVKMNKNASLCTWYQIRCIPVP